MATLYEYFLKDVSNNMTIDKAWPLTERATGNVYAEVKVKLCLDFEANAKYVSFYLPSSDEVEFPEALVLNEVNDAIRLDEGLYIGAGMAGTQPISNKALRFTGRVFLYSERPVSTERKDRLLMEANRVGHDLVFRSTEYAEARNKWEKPLAFISHDSHDKANIAQPLALQLQQFQCPVWFDEFSLKVGDSLRESIEKGLRECQKCVLILTPHFLKNDGWSKREFDSIFTRELIEKQKVILPVWHEVTPRDLYEYSPILADRVALQWSLGKEEVARKLKAAIEAPVSSV